MNIRDQSDRFDACMMRMRAAIESADRDAPSIQLKRALATIGECAMTLAALCFLFGILIGTLKIATLFGGE